MSKAYWDSNSTQREHLKKARDNAIADYYIKPENRDKKAYERFKHVPDYGKEHK